MAFRALVEAARWRDAKDVEAQFARAVLPTLPDRFAFDFPDEDLHIELRVNSALGLIRIIDVGPSVSKRGKQA